jgi:hypothetical protein
MYRGKVLEELLTLLYGDVLIQLSHLFLEVASDAALKFLSQLYERVDTGHLSQLFPDPLICPVNDLAKGTF